MMKTRIHTLLPAALLLLATACEDTLNAPGNPATGNGPTLTLALDNREDNGQTRSELTDGAPVNHVQSVRILVFKVTGDNATYEGEEIYTGGNEGAIAWPEPEGDQEKPYQITYQMNYPFVEDETYTLLGVGQDEQFATTYDLIDNNDKNDIEQGTTLTNAYAKLKENASPKECDFYTGTTTFTYEGRDTHIDDLLMKRRVAGVLLYVNEIPADLPYNNATYRTTRIDLKLGRTQKKSVQLYRDFLAEEWTEPGGEDLTDSDVLLSIDLSTLDYTKKDNQGFYTIDNTDNGLQDDALKAACYMLPLNVPTGKAVDYKTFTVEIYGVEDSDGQGTIPDDAEHVLLKSFTVEQRNTDGESVTSFPIRSNYLYSIGKYDPDAGVDEPISLSGDPIYLEVLPFDELEVSHDFGEAPVQALFDDKENPIYDCINQTFKVKILPPLTTIRSSVTSITLTVDGTTYAMTSDGEFKPLTEQGLEEKETSLYGNWLYIKKDDNTYQKTSDDLKDKLTSADATGCEVDLFMADYARPRRDWGWKVEGLAQDEYSWQGDAEDIKRINNDIRYTTLQLATTFTWNNETVTRYDTLTIKQYNTITVYYNPKSGDNKWTDCGFRRYDHESNDSPTNMAWGYTGGTTYNGYVYDPSSGDRYDGSENLLKIGDDFYSDGWTNAWNGSAPQVAQRMFRKINSNSNLEEQDAPSNKNSRTNKCWYLPAQYEMRGFMILAGNVDIHITNDQNYWSSTLPSTTLPTDDGQHKAIAFKYLSTGNKYDETNVERTTQCRIRQARRFPDDNNYNYQW